MALFTENMAAAKFRLQCADYNTFIFIFKLFSMGIENFDKIRGKFLVEIKREIFRFNSLSSGSKH